jgi:PAS domain S-box-containing protein
MPGYRAADFPLLLIEDNERDAALIQTYLRRDGEAVRRVDRLSAGLEIVRGEPVSEVLLDLNLPDSRGVDTLSKVLEAAPTVPVVVISGLDDPQTVGRAMEAGARDYLVKARLDSETLRRVIGRARERPRTEADFRFTENRYRAVLEAMQEGLVAIDANGVITYVNDPFVELIQHPAHEILGRSVFDFLDPWNANIARRYLERRRKGLMDRYDISLLRPDGTRANLSVVGTPLLDAHGEFMGSVGTFIDLTRQDGRGGTQHEKTLAAIVESTDDAIITCDLNGRILTWNSGAERILGYSREEMIGRQTVRTLVPDDLLGETETMIQSVVDSERVEHFETRRKTRCGEILSVSLSVSPIRDQAGEIVAISAIMRDVTAQKTAERQLQQHNRMSSLGRMATSIAHEFNNVLMGIQPFAEIIERASNDERVRKAAAQIRGSVRRGKAVAEEILRFGNPKPPALESVPVTSWLHSSIQPELAAVLSDNIHLRIAAASDLRILADPSQIAQVLVNLTVNSKHSMPHGGTLTIRVRRCHAGERFRFGVLPVPERFVHFEIIDTGTGMDQATLDRVFEPLFTTKSGGSGLGLPLVHQIIQRHGGHAFVESTPGVGTRFHFFLLAADPGASPNDISIAASIPGDAKRRVLIVEDEMEIALGLKELFSLEGIESEVVYEADAVIAAIERFAPSVVLLDVTLGHASGLDVYKVIAERWPNLPVIFSTGTATEKQIAPLAPTGFVRLLRKPYDFARLMLEIGKATADER